MLIEVEKRLKGHEAALAQVQATAQTKHAELAALNEKAILLQGAILALRELVPPAANVTPITDGEKPKGE